jgi:nucleolar protein 14
MAGTKSKTKGSTLTKLKSNLKDAGLIGPNKFKRSPNDVKAKSRLAQRADAVLESIRNRNPFELKLNKNKHDVLGRHIKGSRGQPGLTRQKGLESVRLGLSIDH